MSDDRDSGRDSGSDPDSDPDRDPDTGNFDADEWFRTQFGGAEPTSPPVVLPSTVVPAVLPPVLPPVVLPVLPPPTSPPMLIEPPPTQPVIELEPTEPLAIVDPTVMLAGPSAGASLGDAATELMRQPEDGGALDELFGHDSFQHYEEAPSPAAPRSSRRGSGVVEVNGSDGIVSGGAGGPADAAFQRVPMGRTQKTLIWVAGSLVALLMIVAVFFVGTRIPLLLGPAPGAAPSPSATPSPTPSPTATERPVGPVEPGDYRWDELWGGECLEPYVDAWQEQFTVVDCAGPHGGQLVRRAPVPLAEGATEPGPYPGEDALAAQMSLLCSAPGVFNLAVAGALTDVQVQGAYPVSAAQWDAGEQDYFCFVSRSSGEPLTGSLAVPPAG